MMKISIIGLGYVGFPLGCLISSKGYEVSGVDVKEEVVEKLNSGKSPLGDDEYSFSTEHFQLFTSIRKSPFGTRPGGLF